MFILSYETVDFFLSPYHTFIAFSIFWKPLVQSTMMRTRCTVVGAKGCPASSNKNTWNISVTSMFIRTLLFTAQNYSGQLLYTHSGVHGTFSLGRNTASIKTSGLSAEWRSESKGSFTGDRRKGETTSQINIPEKKESEIIDCVRWDSQLNNSYLQPHSCKTIVLTDFFLKRFKMKMKEWRSTKVDMQAMVVTCRKDASVSVSKEICGNAVSKCNSGCFRKKQQGFA